jgi:hypothetical protein
MKYAQRTYVADPNIQNYVDVRCPIHTVLQSGGLTSDEYAVQDNCEGYI